MSGGHFNYDQYRIDQIARDIVKLIRFNDVEHFNQWGEPRGYGFTQETINEFQKAIEILDKAYVYVQRIDWLLSGDDGEDDFHKRLKEELSDLKERKFN